MRAQVELILTPKQLAEAFLEMVPEEQGAFFEELAFRTVVAGPFARWPAEAALIAEHMGQGGGIVAELHRAYERVAAEEEAA